MADKITVTVDLHGLEEDLIAMGPKIAKRLFRRALTAVGKVWVEDIKALVPVDTGALRDSIDFIVKTGKNDTGSVTVGPTYDNKGQKSSNNTSLSQSPAVYAMFIEFGLKIKKFPKRPFMRPAFDSSAERMIQFFADNLREDLEDAVKK